MKRILFITLAVLLSTLSASAYVFKVDGIAYALYDNYLSSASCCYVTSGSDKNISLLNIPSRVTYNGYTLPVTSIGVGAFANYTNIKSVTIPNSVTRICDQAFYGCTGLTSITIPNSVTEIRGWAFYGCTGLTLITIPNSVTSILWGAFCRCTGLTSVTIPNSVTEIGSSAFEGCTGLTSVTIGNKVTNICGSAFEGCTGLTSVTFGNSVRLIYDKAFKDCTSLTSVTIPNSVRGINDKAFYNCTGLTSVTIGNSVTKIGSSAFECCTGLTSVTIPNSVTEIGNDAFLDCTGLTPVTIGSSVTKIGSGVFYFTDLKNIYSLNPEPPQFIRVSGAFDSYNKNLFVPKGCVSKYKTARFWEKFKFIGEIVEEGGIDDVVDADSKINYDGVVITMASPSAIAVYSIDGRLVATANGVSLDTESLTHGTYVVRAVDAHGNVQTLKFIK